VARTLVPHKGIKRVDKRDDDFKFALGDYFPAVCPASVALGQFVYFTAVGATPPVAVADPLNPAKMPAAGQVVEKASSTTCVVLVRGLSTEPAAFVYDVAPPTNVYFIGLDGFPTNDAASLRAAGARLQVVGQGFPSGGLLLNQVISASDDPIVTEHVHPTLRQLIHLADGVGGPMEEFLSGAYRETLPSGSVFPTLVIWWTDSGKTQKILQKMITFDGIKRVTSLSWTAYKIDGITAGATVTDTIVYSGVFEIARTRTVT